MDSFILLFLPGISDLDIESLPINEHNGYCTISLKVIPQSFENEIVGIESGKLKIKCHSPAQAGKTNNEVINFFAKILRLPKNLLVLIKGAKSRHKVIKIYKMSALEIKSILRKMDERDKHVRSV